VREVRRGGIGEWRIRESTVFMWEENFTCGHAYICAATAQALHSFIYHLAEHMYHTHNIPPIRIGFPNHPTTFSNLFGLTS
jgi:hypothetical protein